MGQEASLPQADGDEFEEQARAPPSSVNPPPAQSTTGRPGSKMIGAMLHRAAHSNQQHQNFEGKESARAAAGAGQMPFVEGSQPSAGHHYGNGGHPPQQQKMQSQPQSPYPPPNLQQMSPEEQKQYYQQQQVLMMQQQQQQHQMLQQQQQTQQYYDHQHNQGALNVNAASMYGNTTGKKTGRGKALINSMRNLSLGNTIRSGVQGAAHAAAATANAAVATAASATAASKQPRSGGVQEWETRWDEDDDDSDGEDEIDDEGTPGVSVAAAASAVSPMHHPQPPLRPCMDDGHSNMTPRGAEMSKSPTRKNVVTPIQEEELQGADDGLEWDTGAQQKDMAQKPNVLMFLPLLRVLGKGSFGKVVLVQKRVGKERGSLFAMKILRKTHLVKRRQIERTRTERKVLSAVNHPFIMKLHYAFQTPEKLYLVLDYCPGGELFFHLSRFRRFPERVARFYAAELLLAIGHLHKRGIIYRDLKPENVLLDAEGHVKLGDFGLAKAGLKHPCEGAISMCGTPEYMAPEVLSQQGHGFCVDYWGLGMLTYEMMTGLPPWYTTDRSKLFRRLKSAPLEVPNYFSPQSASCIGALLERNPRRRLGVTGVRTAMEHEFFRSINWRALYGRRVEAPIRPCEGWKPPEAAKEGDMTKVDNGHEMHDPSLTASGSENIGTGDLDAATANFDNTFTRMPVYTEEGADQADESDAAEELNEDTFVGFSFDDKDREALASGRQRTQYYHQSNEMEQHAQHHID